MKFLFPILLLIHLSTGQYYLENKTCAVFHNGENFEGDQFTLKDRDQSIRLEDDERASDSGWNVTGSIKVESGCVLEVCSEMYLDGTCRQLVHGDYPTTSELNLVNIISTSCNCHKECKCSDIFIKKSTCARAYLKGGCKTCNSLYTDLQGKQEFFSSDFVGKVEAFRIRKGCKLTLYSEEDMEGDEEMLDSETVEDYTGKFLSYECECDDSKFEPKVKPPRPATYPPLIDIPGTLDGVIKLLANRTYSNHPGLRDAHKSLVKGRSSKNAYILLLGTTGAGKSSAINILFDNPNVTKVGGEVSTTTDIHEFRIPVPVDEMGVANSELRVIDTPGLGDTRGLQQDAFFLATLDAYLETHEELSNRIPNVVLIFHKFSDNRFSGEGSNYVKMLRGLDSVRERITDENYSNVIFVLSHFCSETADVKTRPDSRLKIFKSVIENYSLFPKPIIISVAENKAKEHNLPMVNGYYRLPNNEYYPRNLFEKLELVTEKGGDRMGLAVFRSAFRDSSDFQVTPHTFTLRKESSKLDYYFRIISNAFFSINETEISQNLQRVWDDRIDDNLKKKFPSTLPYLQKALSMRHVNTKEDIPKTNTEIIKLLAAIKHDEATRELLKQSLNIQAPPFPQNTIAGYGYNVFKDTYLPKSPFKLGELKGSDIGFLVPKALTCNVNPGTKQNYITFDTREQYVEHRIKSLGIEGTIANESFVGVVKPGHNIKSISFNEDGCTLSGTQEFRLFDFVINNKLGLTSEFEEAVRNLPLFNETDHENAKQWNTFFDEYGTHVVKSIYGGGAIQIQLTSDKPYDQKLVQKMFDLVRFAEDMSFIVVDEEDEDDGDTAGNGTKSVLSEGISHSLTFLGGDSAYYTNDLTKMTLEQASKLLTDWKKSLKFSPVVLATEMQLVPISQFVKKLGQNYSSEIDRATSLLFNSELKYSAPKKNTSPGNAREDTLLANERLRIEADLAEKLGKINAELESKKIELELKRLEDNQKQRDWEAMMKNTAQLHEKELIKIRQQGSETLEKWKTQREKDLQAYQQNQTERDNKFNLTVRKFEADEAIRRRDLESQIEIERERAKANKCAFDLFGLCISRG